MDQDTKDELREIAASFEEDLQHAIRSSATMSTTEQHEQRLRAIEAALTVLLNALANQK